MKPKWKRFEDDCYDYLHEKYDHQGYLSLCGGSDATESDILFDNMKQRFYIEVKSALSQCGQFVLKCDELSRCFTYSSQNKTRFYTCTQIILNHINASFDKFKIVATKPILIDINKSVFYEWIQSYYQDKGVAYFMTKAKDYLIFPLKSFEHYFDVSASLRIKKSGSSSPNQTNLNELSQVLNDAAINYRFEQNGHEVYLISNYRFDCFKLTGNKNTYLLKPQTDHNYLVRKLSNTYHANVIFRIQLKKYDQDANDLVEFIKEFQS